MIRTRATAIVTVLAAVALLAAAAPAADYYEGKTITILVSSSPGGGTDTTARLVSRYLPKFIPGNPKTIVRNMPGGGGTVANNYFTRRAKPDGMTMSQDSSSALSTYVRGGKRIKYNPREYNYIGSVMRGGSILMVRKDAQQRLADPKAEPVVVGDSDGIRTWVAMTVWGAKYLGWNNRWIFGYAGTGEMVLALRQGEIEMWGTANAKLIRDLQKDGVVEPLVLLTDKRRKDFPDVPTFVEALGDKKPSGVAWQAYRVWTRPSDVDKFLSVPKGTPDNVVKILRDAWGKMVEDPKFQADATKFFGEAWLQRDGPTTAKLVLEATNATQEVKDFLLKIRKEYGLPTGKKKK